MRNYRVILIAFLCGITIFSIFKYISSLVSLRQVKEEADVLQKEKQNLLQDLRKENAENLDLKESLKKNKHRLNKLSAAYQRSFKKAEEFNSQVAALKAENIALENQKVRLDADLARLSQENESFKIKLGSLAELKKTIRELKKQMRKVGVQIQRRIDNRETTKGNRGYLIKDGKLLPISPSKIKIEVIPASK
jgi:chromosome segregation ATPase